MNKALRTLGGLRTRVIDALPAGTAPKLAVILCHGFGAPGDDLAGLGPEMLEFSPKLAAGARLYFPEAPLALDWGGRAWWMIDIEAIQLALMRGEFRQRLRDERPEGMQQARDAVLNLVKDVSAETGLPVSRIALGGFSQGSFVTVDVATQLEETPAGLIVWSGTLMNEPEWRRLGPRHKGLRVVQSHGRQDPMLPFEWAEHLREFMTEVGWQVEWLPFNGPHTISPEGLMAAVRMLEGQLEG
ncbi:MAG: phospholipase [Planctomycetes bacterium]|nr:phospholipase [Planctomycetota bacterium]MCW8136277.1 phospholipase [Planctomycetota bacterium]